MAPLSVIINSDDFGMSNSINTAIVRSFEEGLISSTTLMANMPGFEDAIAHYHSNPVIKNKVGLHMNLTENLPLTDLIKKCGRFCDSNGLLIYNRQQPVFTLSADERIAVYTEIKAQIEKLIKFNVTPTHFDAHHHVHTEFGIAKVYLQLAKEFGIKKIRLSKNIGKISFAKKMYKGLFNFYLQKVNGMTTTDYFCSADEFRSLMDNKLVQPSSSYEVMVHAKLGNESNILDIDGSNMSDKISPIVSLYKPISYFELK